MRENVTSYLMPPPARFATGGESSSRFAAIVGLSVLGACEQLEERADVVAGGRVGDREVGVDRVLVALSDSLPGDVAGGGESEGMGFKGSAWVAVRHGVSDIFRYDRHTGTSIRVSRASDQLCKKK